MKSMLGEYGGIIIAVATASAVITTAAALLPVIKAAVEPMLISIMG